VDRLKSALFWLPTWHDARDLLQCQGVSDEEVADALRNARSIESRSALLTLYRLLETGLGLQRNASSGDFQRLEEIAP